MSFQAGFLELRRLFVKPVDTGEIQREKKIYELQSSDRRGEADLGYELPPSSLPLNEGTKC